MTPLFFSSTIACCYFVVSTVVSQISSTREKGLLSWSELQVVRSQILHGTGSTVVKYLVYLAMLLRHSQQLLCDVDMNAKTTTQYP